MEAKIRIADKKTDTKLTSIIFDEPDAIVEIRGEKELVESVLRLLNEKYQVV